MLIVLFDPHDHLEGKKESRCQAPVKQKKLRPSQHHGSVQSEVQAFLSGWLFLLCKMRLVAPESLSCQGGYVAYLGKQLSR